MRRAVIGAMAVVFMMTALSGCNLWWTETVSIPNSAHYGRATCSVYMYNDSPSGYIKERIDSADSGGAWTNHIYGDVGWIINKFPDHLYSSDTYLWYGTAGAASNPAPGSQGEKYIVGIYPGEAYHMGFYSEWSGAINVNVKTRVVDGQANVINTVSGCEQVQA